jgi:hypothetical protein
MQRIVGVFIAQAGKAETASSGLWSAVPSMIMGAFALLLLVLFWKTIRDLLTSLAWRIQVGAQIKIGKVEIGALTATRSDPVSSQPGHKITKDTGPRQKERNAYYDLNRGIMLVHSLTKSANQMFDVFLYLIPHYGSLRAVQAVEYYFGEYWNFRIFRTEQRYNGFAVVTSAYGPFLCTAKIYFTDEQVVTQYRYIDFEMGSTAPVRLPEDKEGELIRSKLLANFSVPNAVSEMVDNAMESGSQEESR